MNEEHVGIESTTPVVQVKAMGIVRIHASDVERSVRFYKEMLGFREGEQMLEPGVTLEAGNCSIYITNGREPVAKEQGRYPEISLALVVSSVRESHDRLRDAGVTIVSDYDRASEFFASMEIADPDGNVIGILGKA